MKTPNYKDTVGKHPIPHAKGIAKDENAPKNEKENDGDEKKEEGKKNK